MNGSLLYSGHVSPKEVQEAIKDAEWQRLRQGLKGTSLQAKYVELLKYSFETRIEILAKYINSQITIGDYGHELRV